MSGMVETVKRIERNCPGPGLQSAQNGLLLSGCEESRRIPRLFPSHHGGWIRGPATPFHGLLRGCGLMLLQ